MTLALSILDKPSRNYALPQPLYSAIGTCLLTISTRHLQSVGGHQSSASLRDTHNFHKLLSLVEFGVYCAQSGLCASRDVVPAPEGLMRHCFCSYLICKTAFIRYQARITGDKCLHCISLLMLLVPPALYRLLK